MNYHSAEGKTVFIGLLVGLAHIAAGLAVWMVPSAIHTTPLSAFHHFLGWFGADWLAAPGLLMAGFLAVIGASNYVGYRTLFFAPQQVLLMFQLWAIMQALVTGVYPDGYSPVGGGWFIMADQIWAWILAVSHSIWLTAFIWQGVRSGRAGNT